MTQMFSGNLKVRDYVNLITNEDTKGKCLAILDYFEKEYDWANKPSAKSHHHNYKGGLEQHVKEVIQGALFINESLGKPYSDDEIILSAFLHDMDKPYIYKFVPVSWKCPDGIDCNTLSCSGEAMIFILCAKFGLVLSTDVASSIEFAHGGFSTQANNRMISPSPLFCIIHASDLLSSRFGVVKKVDK